MNFSREDRAWGDDVPTAGVEAPGAARLGSDLRAARERLGWTLPAIAAHLRIRLPFLEAIEQGRIHDLPGNTYAVGFVRTYAQALGLDAAEISRRFRLEAGEGARKTELDFPAPVPERGVPALAVVLVGAVLVVGAYVGWYRMSSSSRPAADAVQLVPERLVPLTASKPTTSAPSAPLVGSPGVPANGPSAPAEVATIAPPPPAEAPQPAISPSSAAAATTEPPPVQPSADPAASPADAPHVALRATADAWMQVRNKAGQVLLNRVLRAGETWPVPDGQPALLLTTGNAGGTELVVDGVASAPLGGDGAVRRDLPLGAMKDGALAANAGSSTRRTALPHNQ